MMQELIQNAEDAHASRVVFLLDHTSYPARDDKLHDPGLAQYQVCHWWIDYVNWEDFRALLSFRTFNKNIHNKW